MRLSYLFRFLVGLALIVSASTKALSEESFKGKNVKIIVPYSPGGGWDSYARMAGRYMGRYIPGNPSIIVQNMPGAGGLLSVNFVYNRAKRDGLTMGMFQTTFAFAQLVGDPTIKFDIRKINWIGAFSTQTSTCVAMTDSPFKSIQDVIGSKEPMFVGAGGRLGGTTMEPLLLNEILGTNFKPISGYRGTSGMRMAMIRGELHGMCGWGWSSIKSTGRELLEKGKIRILIQFAEQRHPEIPKDVPMITEMTPKDKRPLLNVYLIPRGVGWNLMLPPSVPQDRVRTLQQAFDKTMQDADFLSETRRARLSIAPLTGEAIGRMFKRLFKEATPEVIAELKKLIE